MIDVGGHRLSWLMALLLIGGTWRISRLIITDQWPGWYQLRSRILRRWPPGPARTTELLICPWCNSMWIAGSLVAVWWFAATVAEVGCLVLSVSAVAALITAWTD